MRLENRVAFVTGGSSGIGAAVALAFAQEGAHIVLTEWDSPAEPTAEQVRRVGRQALVVRTDVGSTTDVNRAVEAGLAAFGRIDILYSNAAITGVDPRPCFEMSDEEFEVVLNVNLKGYFRCCRAVLPSMLRRRYGRIILVGSVVGIRQGWPTRVHYAASKGGVEGMVRSLATEVAPYGITVNCLAPGLVRTPQTLDPKSITAEGLHKAAREYVPVGFVADPTDLAPFAVLLASEESRYLTGTTLLVDGGMMPRSVNPDPPPVPF
jgi:3-oxoacyl-[acyl-carrier protein] reductase